MAPVSRLHAAACVATALDPLLLQTGHGPPLPPARGLVACDLKCRVGNREARLGVTVETVPVATVMLRRRINPRSTTMSTAHSSPTNPAWVEIGRAAPGERAPWIVCIEPVGESGALYRTQIAAASIFTITVDLIAHRGAPARRVHRANCQIPPDADALGEPIRELVKAADEAARTVLTASSLDGPRPDVGTGAIDDKATRRLPTSQHQARTAVSDFDQPLQGP